MCQCAASSTFVTLALATGKTEEWVRTRTGHRSSEMIARYRRMAGTVEELTLGWLKPLCEVIPELKAMGPATAPRLRLVGGRDASPA